MTEEALNCDKNLVLYPEDLVNCMEDFTNALKIENTEVIGLYCPRFRIKKGED